MPLFPPPPPPPPQATAPPARRKRSAKAPSRVRQLRRRAGMPNSMSSARAAPPADGQKSFLDWFREVVTAVVEIVSVEVCAVVPEKPVSDAGFMLHVAGSFCALVVNAQVRATVPVNPV